MACLSSKGAFDWTNTGTPTITAKWTAWIIDGVTWDGSGTIKINFDIGSSDIPFRGALRSVIPRRAARTIPADNLLRKIQDHAVDLEARKSCCPACQDLPGASCTPAWALRSSAHQLCSRFMRKDRDLQRRGSYLVNMAHAPRVMRLMMPRARRSDGPRRRAEPSRASGFPYIRRMKKPGPAHGRQRKWLWRCAPNYETPPPHNTRLPFMVFLACRRAMRSPFMPTLKASMQ